MQVHATTLKAVWLVSGPVPWCQDFRENSIVQKNCNRFDEFFCLQDWLLILNLMKNEKKDTLIDPNEHRKWCKLMESKL